MPGDRTSSSDGGAVLARGVRCTDQLSRQTRAGAYVPRFHDRQTPSAPASTRAMTWGQVDNFLRVAKQSVDSANYPNWMVIRIALKVHS